MFSFGVMGGHYQPVGHTHFLTNMLDFGMTPQEALDNLTSSNMANVGCTRFDELASRLI